MFYGVGLSHIVFTILTMMTAFPHVAIFYHIYCIRYDVSFVDVVKFDYRNFYIKFLVYYTRLYFFSVLHNTLYLYYVCYVIQFCLILADVTAIGIRLSHASRTSLGSWRTAQ